MRAFYSPNCEYIEHTGMFTFVWYYVIRGNYRVYSTIPDAYIIDAVRSSEPIVCSDESGAALVFVLIGDE